ncbi:MAG: NUDIX hydrolase, partial [Bryobacteraceae bacterium]
MSREELLDRIARHVPFDDTEREMTQRLLAFVEAHEDCFRRSLRTGHLTGSAWIVDRTRRRALLVHHKRLDRWMQPGGHWEQDDSLLETARREALEETGATSLRALGEDIFDVDVHPIPARGAEPAHFHYDVRFLFEADPDEP